MIKIQVQTKCPHCNGEAFLPVGEAESYTGEKYVKYRACPECEGSGRHTKWVDLAEFAKLLTQAQCPHKHTSTYGGFHFSSGDVWDNLSDVCDDCGANLDELARQLKE